MTKEHVNNIYVQPAATTRKCECGMKAEQFIFGYYLNAKWRRLFSACQHCANEKMENRVRRHGKYTINARSGHTIPQWLYDL